MGEFELLARIRERLSAASPRIHLGSGDDAAVTVPGGATATSVDALVEGVHFRRDQANLRQIGHKALATALSDLAAMGAEAGEAYVVLGVPPDLDEDGCLELLDGMTALAEQTGTTLAGGDLSRSSELVLALTVVGHARRAEDLVGRRGAHPGEALVVTGELGGAAAGLQLLQGNRAGDDRPSSHAVGGSSGQSAGWQGLLARQLEPVPRLGAGGALARAGATAMIDLSDGLGGDAGHLAESSRVGVRVDAAALPIAKGVAAVAAASGRDPLALACGGGEDYELLAAVPADAVEAATRAVRDAEGIGLTKIGEIVAGEGVEIRLPDGRLLEPEGFDQLG